MKTLSLVILCAVALAACARGGPASPNFAFEAQPRAVLADATKTSAGAQMFFTPAGNLYLLAGSSEGAAMRLDVYVSKNGGDTFDERIPVAPAADNVMTMGEMSPILLEDLAGPSMDVLYEGGDGGLYFSKAYLFAHRFPRAISLVHKTAKSENGFATMALSPTGVLYVAWLDGRASDRNPPNTFSLYVARSTDRGRTFNAPVKVDGGTCPCCRPAFAFGSDGRAYVAWRKDFPGNFRDIVVSTSRDGAQFSAPVRVSKDGWSLAGCPDSGPTLKTVGKRLYVAWYTQGSTNTPQIRIAHTDDMHAFSPARTLPGGVLDVNHPKFVTDSPQPLLVFQGREPGATHWNAVGAFLASVDGDAISQPQAIPSSAQSLTDPIALMRDANTVFVAATSQTPTGPQVVLVRGRRQ